MTTSSDDILAGLLAECSDLILAGATVRACLDRHPRHAAALEPLLTTLVEVRELRAAPVRSAAGAARTREQFMAAAVRLAEEQKPAPTPQREGLFAWWHGFVALFAAPAGDWGRSLNMPAGLLATLIIVILAGMLVTGGVTASAKSLPGDFLYPIKTTTEHVQLFITRDPVVRNILEQKFSGRRIQEAKAVAAQGRTVASLPLDGTIEAINGDTWTVSGLNVTLDHDVQLLGTPTVGAHVIGVMRAPGDGRLIVFYAELETPSSRLAPAVAAIKPTASPSRRAPTATPSPTATATAAASATAADPALDRSDGQRWREPDNWTPAPATATPTVKPVLTATRTPRPTGTPTLTRAPTRTPSADLPPARPVITLRVEGWVERISGGRWTIDGTPINTNGATQIIGNPGVGWKVSALVVQETDGSYTALQIAALTPPATPEPVEFTDILEGMDGEWWTIGGTRVKVLGDTQVIGDPQIGDLVSVKGERHLGEIWALRITLIELTEVQFEGIISAVSGNSLVIGGNAILIDGQTQIIGIPEVGRVAQVAAVRMPDGRLIGKVIMVLDSTPTPTVTATRQATPTPTLTPEPTPTPTLEPTSTVTPEPTPTPTLEPTSTVTPEPTPTPTLEPTSTATLEPAPSATSEPPTASPSPMP